MTASGTDGASRSGRPNKPSVDQASRRTIRDKARRSKIAPGKRRTHTVIARHPATTLVAETVSPQNRRSPRQRFEVTVPIKLPISRDELDAVERLLGRSLRELLAQ